MPGAVRVLTQLDEALDRFADDELLFVDPVALGELAVGLGRVQARLDAAVLRVTGFVDRSVVWSDDGALASTAWLRTRTRCSSADARRQVSHARSLTNMVLVAEALADGSISRSHVAVYAKACTPERAGLFERDEALLLEQTAGKSFRVFSQMIRYWIVLANDELGIGEPDPVDSRTASSRDAGAGMWAITALLDVLDGTEVDNELRRLEGIESDKDWAEARERLGDTATAADLGRTPAKRLADALLEMARRSANSTKPGEPAARIINLRMDYATFVAETAAHHNDGDSDSDDEIVWPTDRVCETEAGAVLAPSRVLDPDIGVHVRRVVFGAKGHVLSFGYAQRLYTGGLRDAVMERDQQCVHPYCETPARRCQVDHIVEYEDGGQTTEANGQLLCGPHNRAKHRHKHKERAG